MWARGTREGWMKTENFSERFSKCNLQRFTATSPRAIIGSARAHTYKVQ